MFIAPPPLIKNQDVNTRYHGAYQSFLDGFQDANVEKRQNAYIVQYQPLIICDAYFYEQIVIFWTLNIIFDIKNLKYGLNLVYSR